MSRSADAAFNTAQVEATGTARRMAKITHRVWLVVEKADHSFYVGSEHEWRKRSMRPGFEGAFIRLKFDGSAKTLYRADYAEGSDKPTFVEIDGFNG